MRSHGLSSGRLGRIFRQWTETRLILAQFFRRYRLDNADCAFFAAAGILLFLAQVEKLLWIRLESALRSLFPDVPPPAPTTELIWINPLEGFWLFPFDGLTAPQTEWLWLGVVFVVPINAWLLDRWLSRISGQDAAVRGWLLKVRWLLLGVPWLGLCVFPAWRALLNIKPVWVFRCEKPTTLDLETIVLSSRRWRPPHALDRGLNSISSSGTFLAFWLVVVNMLAIRAGLAWLNTSERTGCATLLLIATAIAALHLLGFGCLAYYLVKRIREKEPPPLKATLYSSLSLLWFLPMPLPILACLSFVRLQGDGIRTSVRRIYEGHRYPSQLLECSARQPENSLPWPLRGLMGTHLSTDDSVARLRLLKLYRTKTFLLVLDAGSLMLLGPWLDRHLPLWLQVLVTTAMITLFIAATARLLVGLVVQTTAYCARFFRSPEWKLEKDRYPVMRYIMLGSLAVLCGVDLVPIGGDSQALSSEFLIIGSLVFMFSVLYLLPAVGRYLFADRDRDFTLFCWPLVFQMVARLGDIGVHDPKVAEMLSHAWFILLTLVPLWALLLFAWRGHWLIRPFRWSDIFFFGQAPESPSLFDLDLGDGGAPSRRTGSSVMDWFSPTPCSGGSRCRSGGSIGLGLD